MVVQATPVFDSSPNGVFIGMQESPVAVIAQSDCLQLSFTSVDIGAVGEVVTVNTLRPDLRMREIPVYVYRVKKTESYNKSMNIPPAYGEMLSTLKLPQIKQISLLGVYRACTIRTHRMAV